MVLEASDALLPDATDVCEAFREDFILLPAFSLRPLLWDSLSFLAAEVFVSFVSFF